MVDQTRVTIGMPVRNAGAFIRMALDSLLNQTHRHFHLVISDNASTDETADICRDYARRDSRILFIRQPKNIGMFENFRFVLQQADAPYFMWACHDDLWMPTFLEKNLLNLKAHPQASASVSRVTLFDEQGNEYAATGTFPISGSPVERVRTFFFNPGEVSRFYSVFRTEQIREAFPADINVYGYDWVIMALSLLQGNHLELPEVLMKRSGHPPNHYFERVVHRLPRRLDRWLPHYEMLQTLKRKLPPDIYRAARPYVYRLNAIQSLMYLRFRLPFAAPLINAISAFERVAVPSRRHSQKLWQTPPKGMYGRDGAPDAGGNGSIEIVTAHSSATVHPK